MVCDYVTATNKLCISAVKLFRLNEKHFSWFFKGYHLVKKRKIEGTSFNL